eukprot:m.363572 g.363572  ORF g.363572 m.363572 type:complete len:525 (+) comp28070_c0_seq1:1281-2855(+)
MINTATGFVTVVPSQPYSASVEVVAIDAAGSRVSLVNWTFHAIAADTEAPSNGPGNADCDNGGIRVDGTRYDQRFTCQCSRTGFSGPRCLVPTTAEQLQLPAGWTLVAPPRNNQAASFERTLDAGNTLVRQQWVLGRTYKIAPLNVRQGFTNSGRTGLALSFTLQWANTTHPRVFIDTTSGEMLLTIPDTVSTRPFQAWVEASHAGTTPVRLYSITFDLKPADTTNTTNGPDGRDCTSGSDQRVDTVEFDNNYTCNCPTSTVEPNCDPPPTIASAVASASSESNDNSLTYAVVGGLLGLLLVVVAVMRYQVWRAHNRPVDMASLQDSIREALGMGGTVLNIGSDELGLTLSLTDTVAKHAFDAITAGGDEVAITEWLAKGLLESLQQLSGLAGWQTTMLRHKFTVVVVDPHGSMALLRMKRPKRLVIKDGADEDFAAILQHRASKRKLSIDGKHFVQDVAVAVSQRIPAELDRSLVLRLEALGEGKAFALVVSFCRGTSFKEAFMHSLVACCVFLGAFRPFSFC